MNTYAVDVVTRPSGIWQLTAGEIDVEGLARLLAPGEEPLVVANGYVVRSGLPALRSWLLVVTTERLLCIKGRVDRRSPMLEIPRNAIRDVSMSRGMVTSELTVTTGQGDVRLQLSRDSAAAMRRALHSNEAARVPLPAQSTETADTSRTAYLEMVVERLETDVARLQQQVDFLEDLLHKKG